MKPDCSSLRITPRVEKQKTVGEHEKKNKKNPCEGRTSRKHVPVGAMNPTSNPEIDFCRIVGESTRVMGNLLEVWENLRSLSCLNVPSCAHRSFNLKLARLACVPIRTGHKPSILLCHQHNRINY